MPNLTLAGLDTPVTHGGRRPGTGRPRKLNPGETVVKLYVPHSVAERMKMAGDGDPSKGALALIAERDNDTMQKVIAAVEGSLAALQDEPTDAEINAVLKKQYPAPRNAGFDGETIDPLRDDARLNKQMRDVWAEITVNPGNWLTIAYIQSGAFDKTGRYHTDQGISARLRDLRKPKYGCWDVQRKPSGHRGLWLYRLNPEQYALRLAQYQDSKENA